jgi:predicted dithiol-disulfide oxidoreductase (DUF899 family)
MAKPEIVSAEEWEQVQGELLKAEKEATRAVDALAARRRRLPMVRYKTRMGWTLPFVSSRGTSFADDCGAGGDFGFALSVFLRDGTDLYRTYSTTARGVDRLLFRHNILDLCPYGRQEDWEDSPAGWPAASHVRVRNPGYWEAWTAAGDDGTAGRVRRVRRSAVHARPAA